MKEEEAKSWCDKLENTYYFETSARKNMNIEKAFQKLAIVVTEYMANNDLIE